jgi:uncharacterized protein (DUF2062 family)
MGRIRDTLRRRVLTPLLDQLRQGITPRKLALSVAVGVVISVMPLAGVTTIVALAASWALRLNLPAVVAANYAAYPLQILLFIPFFEAGAWLTRGPPIPFTYEQIQAELRAGVWATVVRYAEANARALVAWAVVAPIAVFVLHRVLVPVLSRLPIPRDGDGPKGAPPGTAAAP